MVEQMAQKHKLGRIAGLDFARFLAFFGMVFVNFKVVMVANDSDLGNAAWFYSLLEGRAAALFVILAGLGLGLTVQIARLNNDNGVGNFTTTTIKRGLFLFVIGMINAIIFSADILHYYGIYFLFAAFLAPLSSKYLRYIIIGILLIATAMLILLDFDLGWNWTNYDYVGFFSFEGGIRNLFYNGWHPVFPWLGFLLFGVILSRVNLTNKKVQMKMIILGIGVAVIGQFASASVIDMLFASSDKELQSMIGMFTTSPIPATIIYMITASATACAILAASIMFAKKFAQFSLVKAINTAGRQTLTLYILHIYLGMGIMEYMGMLNKSSVTASIITSILFVFIMAVAANIWSNFFKAGLLETIMRKITG